MQITAQPLLDGIEGVPPARDRLFFALYPKPPAAARIAELARRLRTDLCLKGRPVAEARLHVTLQFLGSFAGLPESLVAAASAAASQLEEAPVEVVFDRAASFVGQPGDRPFVLLGEEGTRTLRPLRRALRAALAPRGLADTRERPFTPHVTLLYDARRVESLTVDPVAWTARELVLVHSIVGQGKHVTLGRWPLGGRATRAVR